MTASLSAVACLTVLAETGTALAAGSVVTRAVTSGTAPAIPARAGRIAGGVAGAALILLAVAGPPPIVVAVAAAATVTAVPFAAGRHVPVLAAGLVVAAVVGGALTGGGAVRVGLGAVEELAAALWLGAVAAPAAAPRRRAFGLAGALTVTAAWGVELLLQRVLPAADAGSTAAIAAARGALTAICLVWLVSALRGFPVPRPPQIIGVAAVVALAAVGTAVRPAAPPVAGSPVLASAPVAGQSVPVLIAPGRPGWNLVHLGPGATSIGTDRAHPVAATVRPGAGNSWAEVLLPAGRSRLWVSDGGRGAWLTIDTGTDRRAADLRGPDGPECASLALGRLLSGHTAPLLSCPADGLGQADAAALRATIQFIAGRAERAIGLVTDDSPRSAAAAAVVRDEAARLHLTTGPAAPGQPVLVLAGWETAARVVQDVSSGRTRAEAMYLAPWLLDTPLLTQPAGQLLPLRFDPREARSLGYLVALGTRFPDEPPSAAGYEGWLGTGPGNASVRLYAASRVYVPGDPLGGHQHHSTVASAAWLPDGTVIAVSLPWAAA